MWTTKPFTNWTRGAVHAAETMAGETIRSVILALSGGRPHSERFGVTVELGGQEAGDAHVAQANGQAWRYAPPDDHELVHLAPVDHAIDGTADIRDPRGLYGERLTAGFHAVSAARGPLRTLRACAGRCHLDVDSIRLAAWASGQAALVEDEMEMGAACLDMGAGATDIAVFRRGALVFADSVPMGGAHVTNDLAYGLAAAPAVAERLKTVHGGVIAGGDDDRALIEVPEIGEAADAGPNHVPRARLVEIVRPRLEETFGLVRERLDSAGLDEAATRRVVLCGGASALSGVRDLAARVLERSVRLGQARGLRGLDEAARGPEFTACAGLLLAARAEARGAGLEPASLLARAAAPFGRLGQWLRESF